MKILLTGKTGQVGWRLARLLPAIGETVIAGRDAIDFEQPERVREAVRTIRPDVIVNAAGITHVDHVEVDPTVAHIVNVVSPAVLAEEARRLGALLVHYSSVYVFDGAKPGAYTEADAPHPINVYGQTKLDSEQAIQAVGGDHLILRASWVYDIRGRNFLLTILQLAQSRAELGMVDDQIGSPTWAHAIAGATADILKDVERARAASGLYNLAALGGVSRYDFTERLLELTHEARGTSPRLKPIKTPDFPLLAERPLNSVLDSGRLTSTFGVPLDTWEAQLRGCLAEIDPSALSAGTAPS